MALKNYLTLNSYSNVNSIMYEKAAKRCMFLLDIFTDETKQTLLASKSFSFDGNIKHDSIFSLSKPQKSPPTENYEKTFYIIGANATGDFAGYDGQLTKYNPQTKNWDKWIIPEKIIFFIEDEQKFYQFCNQKWVETSNFIADARIWDKWLAPEVCMAENKNPMEQIYKFLKTLPEFKNCEDV